jgi:hypothetical protein
MAGTSLLNRYPKLQEKIIPQKIFSKFKYLTIYRRATFDDPPPSPVKGGIKWGFEKHRPTP